MKTYTVTVKQETTLMIQADNKAAALDEAYRTYLGHAADSVDASVVAED